MVHLTFAQRESLKKAVTTAMIHRLSTSETCDMIRHKLGIEMSYDYIAHMKADLKKESEKQIEIYKKDKFAFIEGAFSKRLAEFEDNQNILRTIIYSNKDNPEAQIKAVVALNDTITLIANLFQMLPSMNGLGMDAFMMNNSSNNSDNDNNNSRVATTTTTIPYLSKRFSKSSGVG